MNVKGQCEISMIPLAQTFQWQPSGEHFASMFARARRGEYEDHVMKQLPFPISSKFLS
jgi:hypothetical protein